VLALYDSASGATAKMPGLVAEGLAVFPEDGSMLTLQTARVRLCDGVSRRDFIRVGSLGAFGLSLAALLKARACGASRTSQSAGRARACIVFYLSGGPPQHETWDPKPDAPAEIRGDFRPIASSVPGLRVGELMPRVAALTHHCCVLRAVSTADNAHSSSGYWMLTGQPYSRPNTECNPPTPGDWPCLGAVVKRLRPGNGTMPPAVTLPEQMISNANIVAIGQHAGWLGRAADPWLLMCDPASPSFAVPALSLPGEVPPLRLDGRRSLLQQVNDHLDAVDRSGALDRYDSHSRQAFDLLRGSRARRAFDLNEEPPAVRDRYGRNKVGQSVLLARRLAEAGVSLVQVNWPREPGDMNSNSPVWDTHSANSQRLQTALMPPMDQAYSALLEDLAQRGLLDETLVVWMGEFGRTPRINASGGRDHWGQVFSIALAGGGIRGGVVHGASDSIGAYPRDGRVQPQDLAATIFHCIGLPANALIHDPLGRPVPITHGDVIRQAF
jgi:hypothetical protein